jgi:Ca2+-binding RTX toxin-like protein
VLTLINSTLSGNSAGFEGGGVANRGYFSGASTMTLTNSTLSVNSANIGGGVTNRALGGGASVILTRNLISGNTAPSGGAEVRGSSGTITAANSNLFGHSGLTNAQAFFGFIPGVSDLTATSDGTTPTALAAILKPTLANNGGLTQTHNLVSGSPARNASPDDADCQPADQRGVPRPQGPQCDIGAVEVPVAPTLASLCPSTTPTTGCTVNGMLDQLCRGTAGPDTITGTAGDDVILGRDGDDIIEGKGGNDCINGGGDNDEIVGGAGNDVLFGGSGNNTVLGGGGADVIVTKAGDDKVNGGKGADVVYDSGGTNAIRGKEGEDVLLAPRTNGTVDGGEDTDVCIGGTTQISCP